jgi:hypothetical protein
MHTSGTGATTEICIFCHTPHGGNQSVSAPIWNRTVSSTSVYTRFSTLGRVTFDAKEAPIGSVSIACLSCHDGTQARDAVINGPGSGNNNNLVGAGGVTSQFYDGSNPVSSYLSGLNASDNGTLTGDLIYLGTDLRNDHPISMQYGGGGMKAGVLTTKDPDFAKGVASGTTAGAYGLGATGNGQPTSTNVGVQGSATGIVNTTGSLGAQLWWVDTGTAGYQANDFPLYTRTDMVGDATPQPFVECGTCHDPHSNNTTFLRLGVSGSGAGNAIGSVGGANAGSQVCLTCHAK